MNQSIEFTLPVSGMTCASCAAHIEKALNGVEGVVQANVNLATERASLQLSGPEVKTIYLVQAVQNVGFISPQCGSNDVGNGCNPQHGTY
ncbi:MAG: hypothetical protein GTN46_06755 [Gammaproteobacteria bacterium]|nr:hypothetical protein [Gammaproteobacteria bacterium]